MRKQAVAVKQPTTLPKHNSKIDLAKLAKYISDNPNLSERNLSKIFGVSQASIWEAKQKIDGYDKETIDKYSKEKANIFLEGQRRILQEHLSIDRVKKMQPHQAALWFNSLYNNYRLETNQSTDNVTTISVLARDVQKSINNNDND